MKKTSIIFGLIFILAMVACGSCFADECEGVNIDFISSHVTLPGDCEIVASKPTNGFCEVVLGFNKTNHGYSGMQPVWVSKDFVLIGSMFSHKGQLGIELMQDVKKQMFSKVKENLDSAVFTHYQPAGKHIKNELYVFTSPKCGYCKRLESSLKKIADDTGTRINMILYPIHGDDDAKKILSNGVTFDEYVSRVWENYEVVTDNTTSLEKINIALELGNGLGVRGTPTMFTSNGDEIVGADIDKIYSILR